MPLFENFNTSNQTSPWFERHENFVIDLKSPGCAIVQTLDFEDRCTYVDETPACREEVQIFDYTHLFYCAINIQNVGEQAIGVCMLFLICFYMFAFVGTATDKFFCPPLKIITKKLGISENLAGVTLLAFGNSAPDLVTSLVGITGEVGTMYSDLMGSAMFITAFISGAIVIMKPLQVEAATFTRDISFHILAIIFIDYAIKSDRVVTVTESIVILSIYGCYITVVILDQVLLTRTLRNLTNTLKQQDTISDDQAQRLEKLQEEAGIEIVIKPRLGISANISKKTEFRASHRNEGLFRQLWTSLMPVDMNDWRQSGWLSRLCIILQVPMNVVLFLLVPTVDYDLELSGWSKLLNCLQIVMMPAAISFITADMYTVFGFSVPIFICFITVPLCIASFLVTRTDSPPSFHLFFAIFSITGSICIIRISAREILNVIDVLGIVTYSSTSFLGCTILAWGNCVGDLIASIALTQQGFQRMGLASCIAGPLFYLTLGLGCTYLYKSLEDENHVFEILLLQRAFMVVGVHVIYETTELPSIIDPPSNAGTATQGSMGENCTVFLIANLIGLLLGTSTTNFNIRRSIGIHLMIVYALFCLYCLLGEYQFIHPFGTDHTEDYGIAYL